MDAPKKLEWSHEQIARFWDYTSARETSQETYFALQVGEGVARLVEHVRPLSGLQVLDFGSGPGHLIPRLLNRGALVSATDYSSNSIAEVNRRFSNHANWKTASVFDGNRLPWDDNSFDAVFCLETIEHLHTDDCSHIFDELHRVLQPGGFAVYTTPNEEDLSQHNVYCPNCNCEFHRMQHLRSWSSVSLTEQLAAHGYEVGFCRGLDLHNFQTPNKWRFSTVRSHIKNTFLGTLDRLFPKPFPFQRLLNRNVKPRRRRNLVAVANKRLDAVQPTLQSADAA